MCSTSGQNRAEVAGRGNKRCREIGHLLLQHSQLSGEELDLCLHNCSSSQRQVLGVCVGRGHRAGRDWGSDRHADGCHTEGTQDSSRVNSHHQRVSPARGPRQPSLRFPLLGGGSRAWRRGAGWGRRGPRADQERGGSAQGQGEGHAPAQGHRQGHSPPRSRGGSITRGSSTLSTRKGLAHARAEHETGGELWTGERLCTRLWGAAGDCCGGAT